MRRKWGKGFDFTFLRNGSLPKPTPRKWGRGGGSLGSFRIGTTTKSAPRRWGTRRGFASPRSSGSSSPTRRFASQRRPKRMKRKYFWLIISVLLLFIIIQSVMFLDRELRTPLMFLAKIRINQMATEAINSAITEEVAQTADGDKLIQWKTTPEGKITGFLIDYKEQMGITAKTIAVVTRVLKQHEDVPEHIPIGHALNSPFLSSLGPRVSVTFHPASVIKVDIETQQSEAGINMLLVEVYIRIRTEVSVIIPFDQAPEMLETKIPLSYVLVVGDVPTYYYDNKGNPVGNAAAQAPTITLPDNIVPSPQVRTP
jgi:sporulation protein YunB